MFNKEEYDLRFSFVPCTCSEGKKHGHIYDHLNEKNCDVHIYDEATGLKILNQMLEEQEINTGERVKIIEEVSGQLKSYFLDEATKALIIGINPSFKKSNRKKLVKI